MYTRKVMIVDDSKNLVSEIRQYNNIFNHLKLDQGLDYDILFEPVQKYDEAIKLLESSSDVFDVLLIDYDLRQSGNTEYGTSLVKEIRRKINKHCKIIFYTMGDLSTIFPDRNELIEFFNEGIFKFLSKDTVSKSPRIYGQPELQLRVETIIDAINNIDFVQVTLERYFAEYREIITDERIKVNNKEYTIEQLISLIKRDDIAGRTYKNNLAESIIIRNITVGDKKS